MEGMSWQRITKMKVEDIRRAETGSLTGPIWRLSTVESEGDRV